MPLQGIGNLIGQSFGGQALQQQVAAAKRWSGAAGEFKRLSQDIVDLSPQAPKPLSADVLRDAFETGERLARGEELTSRDSVRLREDRIFAALTAMAAMQAGGKESDLAWSGGFPAPSAEEMAAAERRLAQRLIHLENVRDPSMVQKMRTDLLDYYRTGEPQAEAAAMAE